MTYLVAAVAWVGHLVLMIGSHNWVYGHALGKKAGDVFHLLHALAVLLFGPVLLATFGWHLTGLLDPSTATPVQLLVQGYGVVCLLAALGWLPVVTVWRALRRDAATAVRGETIDVARQLGHRPLGNGHHAFLGKLPGNEIFRIECNEKTLVIPRLPAAWDGLTVLHLSDIHLHGTPDEAYFRTVFERCAAWQPDLVAITGDVVDTDTHHAWVAPLLGLLRWRVAAVAILGNHDHRRDVDRIRGELRRLNMLVPENSWTTLQVRGEPLVVIGHEGPWLQPPPDLSGCPTGPFRLLLSHTPDNIAWAKQNAVDLMLSGHVHGGQIRVPVFGSLLLPSVYGRTYDAGTFAEPPTLLHVSRGVSGEHPVRYGCLPEVTLLTLQGEKNSPQRTQRDTEEKKES
ncbi:MAG: metallophosphoesterase [Gemmataceae bacterium]